MTELMYLKLTEKCNMNCPFCYVKHKDKVITMDIIKDAINKYKPKNIVFHGGEPSLYPELIKNTMEYYDCNYSITTNLMEITDIIKNIPITTSYSIDRFNETTWNTFVNNCKQVNIDTIIVTITEKQLNEDVYVMVDKLLKLKPKTILLERCYGNYSKEFYERTDEYISKCMDVIPYEINGLYKDIIDSITYNTPLYDTKCSEHIITVNPDGSVQHCPTKFGIENTKECSICELYPYCKGDCECFRGFCKFPKKTVTKLLNKDTIGKKDRLKEWLKNNTINNKTIYEVVLTISDECNRKCSFCPRGYGYKSPYKNHFMSLDLIKKLCNDLGKDYTGMISMSGFGEPLLHPQFKEIIKIIKDLCPKSNINVITNGDDIDVLKDIDGIFVEFSMYSQYSEEKMNEIKSLKCKYIIKDVEHKDKNYFNNRAGNAGKIVKEPLQQCCNLPFYKMSIDSEGNIIPCCSDWGRENIFGNIKSDNIYDVWNNSKYTELRNNLILGKRCGLCSKCDINGLIAGKEFVDYWRLHAE